MKKILTVIAACVLMTACGESYVEVDGKHVKQTSSYFSKIGDTEYSDIMVICVGGVKYYQLTSSGGIAPAFDRNGNVISCEIIR